MALARSRQTSMAGFRCDETDETQCSKIVSNPGWFKSY